MSSNPKLALLISKESNEQYSIDTFAFAIGRGAGNNIVISRDALVSRQHAVLLHINGKMYLQDIGSRNGTMINGKRIQSFHMMQLRTGDEICIGMTKFLVTDLSNECQSKIQADTVPLQAMIRELTVHR
jgi:pSer/pThr/pTyr-binding forkhead associated (FHA) protein